MSAPTHRPGPGPSPEARRRVVALALARRPGLDLDGLHAVLARLDVTVDRVVLVDDLATLGLAVADDGRTLRGSGDRRVEGADRGTGGGRRSAGAVVVLAVLTILAVVVGVLVAGGDGDAPDSGSLPAPLSPGDRGADPTGPAPGGPDLDLDLGGADLNLALDFAGQAATLPRVDDLGDWVVGRGTWAVQGDRAQATPDGGSALAWLATPGGLEAQVVAPAVDASVGLAVRVVAADTYVAWVREPTGAVALLRVAGPVREVLARVPGAAVGREGAPLGLRVTATGVDAFVGGVQEASATLTGPLDAGASGLGLVVLDAGPATATATFDDLLARFTP